MSDNFEQKVDEILDEVLNPKEEPEIKSEFVTKKKDNKNTNTKTKKPLIIRFISYFIPWKGDKIGEIFRKLIFLTSLIVIGVCIYQFSEHLGIKISQTAVIEDMQSIYNSSEVSPELIANLPEGASEDFATLYAQNSDVMGWLSIPNADMNYVVVQSKDSVSAATDKYLYSKNWKGEDAKYGWPYIDQRCHINKDGNISNIVIYGHNMYPLDETLFFSNLVKYESLDYYKQNPIIFFDTLYGKGTYKIFAVMLLDTQDTYKGAKLKEGEEPHIIFDYLNDKYLELAEYIDFDGWRSAITERNLINTEVDIQFGDEFLTLSTCENRYFNEGRIVVIARKVREGESEQVNVTTAVASSNPTMPDIWVSKGKGKLMQ